jgi:hypothetical protein
MESWKSFPLIIIDFQDIESPGTERVYERPKKIRELCVTRVEDFRDENQAMKLTTGHLQNYAGACFSVPQYGGCKNCVGRR